LFCSNESYSTPSDKGAAESQKFTNPPPLRGFACSIRRLTREVWLRMVVVFAGHVVDTNCRQTVRLQLPTVMNRQPNRWLVGSCPFHAVLGVSWEIKKISWL
jgi:hypothetical protein